MTPAQLERLAILMEEAGEVVQVCGKILRHGYQDTWPEAGATNQQLLERELGDLMWIVDLMARRGDLVRSQIKVAYRAKPNRARPWLRHQEELI